jgi:hypothetical protein
LEHHERRSAAWESGWGLQQQWATVFTAAMLPGGSQVTSRRYLRSRSRDGTRVLVFFETSTGAHEPAACEVECWLQLQQPAAADEGVVVAESFAMLRVWKTTRLEDPDLTDMLLAAKPGAFERDGGLFAVPLDLVSAPLHACRVDWHDGNSRLLLTPVHGMSKRLGARLPV